MNTCKKRTITASTAPSSAGYAAVGGGGVMNTLRTRASAHKLVHTRGKDLCDTYPRSMAGLRSAASSAFLWGSFLRVVREHRSARPVYQTTGTKP